MLYLWLCTCVAPAQAADPILMLLLSVAREMVTSAASRAPTAEPAPPPASTLYPGTSVEPQQVRRLIDECFRYLSQAQRQEIFDSLHAALTDSKNAAVRASMIDLFVSRAVAIREAQEHLAKLSGPDKDRLLVEFRSAVAVMPADDAAQLALLLRQGVLPVPSELNDQLLAALDAR